MLPTYQSGARLLGLHWFRRSSLRPGQVVVATQAGRIVIKRLAAVTPPTARLEGDNQSASTDSRTLGPVALSAIKALIIAKVVQ
jgi:hypothetical protein